MPSPPAARSRTALLPKGPAQPRATAAQTGRTAKLVDVMLDLETFGSRPGAVVTAIGATAFGAEGVDTSRTFYRVLDVADSCTHGLVLDPGTVLWWLKQSDAARAELQRPGELLVPALEAFKAWLWTIADRRTVRVWGNGAAFDNAILAAAYHAAGLPLPWEFWHDRCFRTVRAAYPGVPYVKPERAHHALADATAQAEHVVKLCARGLVLG